MGVVVFAFHRTTFESRDRLRTTTLCSDITHHSRGIPLYETALQLTHRPNAAHSQYARLEIAAMGHSPLISSGTCLPSAAAREWLNRLEISAKRAHMIVKHQLSPLQNTLRLWIVGRPLLKTTQERHTLDHPQPTDNIS
jgi:hypothetical protein